MWKYWRIAAYLKVKYGTEEENYTKCEKDINYCLECYIIKKRICETFLVIIKLNWSSISHRLIINIFESIYQ